MVLTRRFLLAVVLVLLAGCQQQAQPTPRPIPNELTAIALTPTTTPTLEPTATLTPLPATPTVAATVRPSPTAGPSPTPLPATPEPSAQQLSYCETAFGAATNERFSARLRDATISRSSIGDQFIVEFTPVRGQVAGRAVCIQPAAANVLGATSVLSGVLRIELPLWQQDAEWAASALTTTKALRVDAANHIESVVMQAVPNRSAGVVIELGLDAALPFSAKLEGNRLVIQLADAPTKPLGDDPLGTVKGQVTPPLQPLIFGRAGDLLKFEKNRVTIISSTLAIETSVALSPDRRTIAFCRSAPDALPEQGGLWVSDLDGKNEQLLADVGGCADPAWSFDGKAVWFVAPWSSAAPASYRLWTVPADGGEASPKSSLDEWSRRAPQPLPGGDVLTVGNAEDGRGALLLTNSESGVASVLGQSSLGAYPGIGRALLAPDGKKVAVEALRNDGGADLLVLDTKGKIQTSITGDWWNRPLAWSADGTLYYLVTTCRAGLVLSYELHSLAGRTDKTVSSGGTLGDIGSAVATDEGLVYVRTPEGGLAVRGPEPFIAGPSEVWLLEDQSGNRARLLSATDGINMLR